MIKVALLALLLGSMSAMAQTYQQQPYYGSVQLLPSPSAGAAAPPQVAAAQPQPKPLKQCEQIAKKCYNTVARRATTSADPRALNHGPNACDTMLAAARQTGVYINSIGKRYPCVP
jgi:hypothetical protein